MTTTPTDEQGLAGLRAWLRDPRILLRELLYHPPKAWAVLVLSLAITWLAWFISESFVIRRGQDRFRFETEDIKHAISKRMEDQEKVLRGGVGLFAASTDVTRAEWKAYVNAVAINRYYPGLQGFGYSRVIPPEGLEAHIRSIRAEGFPEYTVRPAGSRPMYTAIVFLEPFDWRNRRAFGYDMFSQPTRRAAMERARDTGEASVTSMVTLVQETDKNVQHGFLMYLPVYRTGAPLATLAERRAALQGFVYSPFRMNDLMKGILGVGKAKVRLEIFDGRILSADNLLYDSRPGEPVDIPEDKRQFERTTTLPFNGVTWTLRLRSDAQFISSAEESQPLIIAAGGLLIDLLVFLMIGSIARQHRRATDLAQSKTEELREQTARTQTVLDTVLEGIITIDDKGLIVAFNPAAAEIFGYVPDEVVGKNVSMLMPEPDRSAHDGYIGKYLDTGKAKAIGVGRELEGERKDGTTFPMELAVSSMQVAGERLFTGVVRDITERKRIEKLQSEFIGMVSHELRTPLTSLSGSLRLLSSGSLGPLPDNAKSLLNISVRNAKRLTLLVNDILDIEKLKSGKAEFSFSIVDTIPLMQEAIEENAAYGVEHGVRFRLDHDAETAYAKVDPGRVLQVMANLLSNAAKYSDPGSEVVVQVLREDHRLRVAVVDYGCGIPEDKQSKLFERFFQADSSDSRSKQGTGLGLAIVKAIVEAHGSEIRVVSKVGGGSTFYFDLDEADAPHGEKRDADGTVNSVAA